jgi:hypothetical protein
LFERFGLLSNFIGGRQGGKDLIARLSDKKLMSHIENCKKKCELNLLLAMMISCHIDKDPDLS